MSEKFLQHITIESAIIPIDLAGQANNGDWVSMKNYRKALVVLFCDAGTAGEDPVFKLQQATDVAGTSAKDLLFTTIYEKVGTLSSVTAWTRVTQTAATSYTNAASGEAQNLIVVEVDAAELDVDGGFDCIQLSVADTGVTAGKIGAGLYILFDPRYPQAAMDTALTD